MTAQLLFLGTMLTEICAFWLVCGLCALILLRLVQARDPTTIVIDADISGSLWCGGFSLMAILAIIFCRIVYPITYLSGWIGRKLGIKVNQNPPYTEKGFFAKYFE